MGVWAQLCNGQGIGMMQPPGPGHEESRLADEKETPYSVGIDFEATKQQKGGNDREE